MVDIVANPEWKSVRILERDEVALGGYGGNMNEQATALVARTEFLDREKADRNDIVQGQYSFSTLADFNAVKATLPPNSVIIIDEAGSNQGTNTWNGTTLTKSAYDPLTQAKGFVEKTGYASIVGVLQSNINYITATRTLEFKHGIDVVTGTNTYSLSTPQSVDLPLNTPSRLEYVVSSGSIVVVARNASRVEGNLVIGLVTATESTLKTLDFAFTVDGVELCISENGKLINHIAFRINFDNTSKSLKMTSGSILITSPSYSLIIPTTVDLPYPSTSGDYKLSFNRKTKAFSFIRVSAVQSSLSQIDLATVVIDTSLNVTSVIGIDLFTIDGVESLHPQYGQLIAGTSSRINFDTTLGKLNITAGNVILKSPKYSLVIPTTHSIDLPTTGETRSLIYNIKLASFYFVSTTASLNLNEIVVATIYRFGTFRVTGIDLYTLNGVSFPSANQGTKEGVQTGYMIATRPSEINFDFVSRQITIAKDRVRMITSKASADLLPETVIDISGSSNFVKKLMYDTVSKQFRHVSLSTPTNDSEVQVAVFDVAGQLVHGVPYYSINGRAITKFDSMVDSKFNIPFGDLSPDYSQPTLDGYQAIVTEHLGDHTRVYDMYDSLMGQHPSYITKESIGVDGLGNTIYQYTFSTNEVFIEPSVGQSQSKKPKVILISGIHGAEKAGIYNTYFALKEIAKRWKEDKRLEALYWGVTFVVVPISVPTAYDLHSAYNHNNVNMCRNFSEGWQPNQNQSGPYAMSELETICLDAMMANNKDAIYFCSHHNMSMNPDHFIWNTSATVFGADLTRPLIIRQTLRAKELYPSMSQADDYYIGYADSHTPNGSESYQATRAHGIQGGIFEVANAFYWDAVPQQYYSSSVATMGVEALINWLLLNVKYGCELYNSKVNL